MQGQLEPDGQQWKLCFTRELSHPREKVWRALTEREHLRKWFPTDIEGERRSGAPLRFAFPNGEGPTLEGEMLVYDPPDLLELRWGDETLRFELQPHGQGTILTLVNTFEQIGKASRDAAGWHACLDTLQYVLGDQRVPWSETEHWQQLHASYVESFGAEASTIGPPSDHPYMN